MSCDSNCLFFSRNPQVVDDESQFDWSLQQLKASWLYSTQSGGAVCWLASIVIFACVVWKLWRSKLFDSLCCCCSFSKISVQRLTDRKEDDDGGGFPHKLVKTLKIWVAAAEPPVCGLSKFVSRWRNCNFSFFFLSFCLSFVFWIGRAEGRRSERRRVYSSAIADKVMEKCASEKQLDGATDGGAAVPISWLSNWTAAPTWRRSLEGNEKVKWGEK